MSGTAPYERLFSPIDVGPIHLRNRICETTNTIGAGGMAGFVDDGFIAHHAAKARGGTAWIGGETFLLNSPMPNEAADEFFPGSGAIRIPIYLMPGFVESVAKFCDALHEVGSVGVFQLTHLNMTMAASSVPIVEIYDSIPHELDEREIEAIIESYAAASAQFLKAGGDGIEIHCAHETVPQTFLSPAMNKRRDDWGGDAEKRTLFVRRILERVRERIGDTMALGIRINGQESREGGYDLAGFREMMEHIAATGTLDFVNVDVGHSWGNPSYVQSSYYGAAPYREAGRALRSDLPGEIKILFAGRVGHPDVAEELLAAGVCDLVGMTRAGIADPEFANKAREGRVAEIRPCIGCNRCIGQSIRNDAPDAFKRPTCSVNPRVGHELHYDAVHRPAESAKRFVVVGGGPAGLEAARVAAERGHDVVLIERERELGGQIRYSSQAPGRAPYRDFVTFQEDALGRLGVDVRLEQEVSLASLRELAPDAVACATGARARIPDTPGVDQPHVVTGWQVLAGAPVGDRVAVVSQEDAFQTPNVAHYLAERGKQVEIFHKWTGIGSAIDRYSIGPVMRALSEHDVVIHSGLRLAAVEGSKLAFTSAFDFASRSFDGFDTVVLVYGSVPDARLHRELETAGAVERLFLVGAAWVPRGIAEATQHGARVGMEV